MRNHGTRLTLLSPWRQAVPRCLLVAVLATTSCDPSTASRIVNSSGLPIEVELVLDRANCVDGYPNAETYGVDQLQDLGASPDVELLSIDSTNLVGRYRIAVGGQLPVHAGLGREPKTCLTALQVEQNGRVTRFEGAAEVVAQFTRLKGEEGNLFTLDVTDGFGARAR